MNTTALLPAAFAPEDDGRLTESLGAWLRLRASSPALASWATVLGDWLGTPHAQTLLERIEARQTAGAAVLPRAPLRALELTPLPRVRVVILGQDPYHGPQQAQGLAFSVPCGFRPLPPSLRNILRELVEDIGQVSSSALSGDLTAWAEQGVLLLNTALTVELHSPGAHLGWGWEGLAERLLQAVLDQSYAARTPVAAVLWGAAAQAKWEALQIHPHQTLRVFRSNHPSPLSARRPPVPFVGSKPFSGVNAFLAEYSEMQISW